MSEVGLTLCVCVEYEIGKEGKLGNAAATTSLKTVDEVIITLTHLTFCRFNLLSQIPNMRIMMLYITFAQNHLIHKVHFVYPSPSSS